MEVTWGAFSPVLWRAEAWGRRRVPPPLRLER